MRSVAPGESVSLLLDGGDYPLGGQPLEAHGNVTIAGGPEGATLDGEGLSALLTVSDGGSGSGRRLTAHGSASVHLVNLRLVNGLGDGRPAIVGLRDGGVARLKECIIERIRITGSSAVDGGLFQAVSALLLLSACTIRDVNVTTSSVGVAGSVAGGLVQLSVGASAHVDACTIDNITISSPQSYIRGGVFCAVDSSLRLSACTISQVTNTMAGRHKYGTGDDAFGTTSLNGGVVCLAFSSLHLSTCGIHRISSTNLAGD
eukprot:4424434-Prymnesium_polylepis.1